MDADQFSRLMEMQRQAMQALIGSVKTVQLNQPAASVVGSAAASSVPLPPPLELEGDMEQNFNFFEENWKTYASAVGMDAWPADQNKQKTSILLSVVGKHALKKFFNFELNQAQQNDPELALAAIKSKVVRERNKFVDWFDFFSLMQDSAESIDNYLCRVKSLAKLCKFGVLEGDMIRYKLATSIKWMKLRSKLITTQNLTEAHAMDFGVEKVCKADRKKKLRVKQVREESSSENDSAESSDSDNDESSCAQNIVKRHEEVFHGIGKFAGAVSLEVSADVSPSIQPPRRVPIALREKLKKELKNLERDGLIVKENRHTEWVSNIVLVKRKEQKSESVRVCLDPIPLNAALKRPHVQFTTIDEILPELGKAKVFSTADVRKGFWHVLLDEKSSRLTTFWTPFGRYPWIRLPFGIAPAPDIFHMKLQEVIQGLLGVECVADDLLIYGSGDTLEEALENHNICLEKLLVRLKECNVKLNFSKLKLCETSVKFYGHVLTNKGLQPDESKVASIKNFPRPSDRKQLQRFIGMVNYLSRFIPNLSANFTVLRRLISEKENWVWSEKEEEEFDRVKRLVADANTLRYYNVNEPIVIECDASSYGLGAAVFQSHGNYAQIEKELLAILFACVRFDQLIVGNPKITVKTDHKPLVTVFRKPLLSAPRRLQHMLLNLQRYRLTIEFVTGKDNVVADAISRAPFDENLADDRFNKRNIFRVFREIEEVNLSSFLKVKDEQLNEIIAATEADTSLQQVVQFIRDGWPTSVDRVPDSAKMFFKYRNELSTQEGIIYRNDRIVVPYTLRRKLTAKVHVSHNGMEATLKLARANLFWPGMSAQIKEAVAQCGVCAKYQPSQTPAPMQSHPIPVYPFQLVSMDVFFADYQGRSSKFLVTVDHFSDFFEVDLLKDLTPRATIAVCKSNFSRHGTPQQVISGNETNFVNREWKQFAREWDFYHSTSAPHHQQANGKAEAAVKIAKRLLKKAEEAGNDFWYALLHWRNVPNKVGSSPAARLFSRNTRCGVPMSTSNLKPKLVSGVPEAIEERRRKAKFQYDRKTRNLPNLETGSAVYVQLQPETSKKWTPARVSNKLNERSYVVDVDGMQYRRDLVHLKPRNEPQTPEVNPDQVAMPNVEPVATEQMALPVSDGAVSNQEATISVPDTINPEATSAVQLPKTSRATRPSKDSFVEEGQSNRPKRNVKLPMRLKDYCLE
ncbi:uncharacterized protein K02A2.6-like [Aedes albopictus]|uniref:RNA-directed DNA polymerase n=1 Tax=Aedes albopictus TaxID=7160 RepID=A0ABM1Y3R0_AEDAL